jgi:hypothetical protein
MINKVYEILRKELSDVLMKLLRIGTQNPKVFKYLLHGNDF